MEYPSSPFPPPPLPLPLLRPIKDLPPRQGVPHAHKQRDLYVTQNEIISKAHRIISYVLTRADDPSVTLWKVHVHTALTPPVIQIGPSCGFAALSMVGQLLTSSGCKEPVKEDGVDMLAWAREMRFTNLGEMFSTQNMLLTLQHHFDCDAEIIALPVTFHVESVSETIKALDAFMRCIEGGMVVLLPYDKGPNHEPITGNGHSAHWCVVLGTVKFIPPPMERVSGSGDGHTCLRDVFRDAYVLCRHGKSSHYAIWNLVALIQSNHNLYKMRPGRGDEESEFVVSDRYDLKDIRGSAILVKTKTEMYQFENLCKGLDQTEQLYK